MRKKYPLGLIIALMLITASATFVISLFAIQYYYGMNSELYGEIRRYQEAREIIEQYYVGEYDEGELTDASIAAAMDALDDQWSFYMTAVYYEAYQKNLSNQYEGIGITYSRTEDENYVRIETVSDGSPAQGAGLEVGEFIKDIDGQNVQEMGNEEVRDLIISRVGSSVLLTVKNSQGSERSVEVESKKYYVNPISYKMIDGDIGYIAIANFDSGSGQGAIAAINSLIEQGAKGLVFDVRNNGGGLVSELLELLDYLLPEGELFVTADRAGGEIVKTSNADSIEIPMSVLVNQRSYSAAEFFGAILQEYDWAAVVGEPTTGKGRSQITLELSDGGAIHISSKTYYTPNRVDLSEAGGIVPNYVVEADEGSATDLQLEKAVEILR